MSAAERPLDLLRRVAAREDESQVLPALGQRNELLAQVGGDRDLLDPGKILRRVLAAHGHETPGARDREHHHAGGLALATARAGPPAQHEAPAELRRC